MVKWIQQLDRILRGEATSPEALTDGSVDLSLDKTAVVGLVLAAFYGVCMGTFSLFKSVDPSVSSYPLLTGLLQLITTTIKVPALFALTLMVTFPSLYVFNALVGSRLTLPSLARLLTAAMAVNLSVLASLGPIVAFFSISTSSYSFIVLFNVLMFTMAGVLGLAFLLRTLNRLTFVLRPTSVSVPREKPSATGGPQATPGSTSTDAAAVTVATDLSSGGSPESVNDQHGALDVLEGEEWGKRVRMVFSIWLVLFSLVGSQMGWVLRPFIGNPNEPFGLFRPRESSFFVSVLVTFAKLLGLSD